MSFLLDQRTAARLIPSLTSRGHEATRVGRDDPAGLAEAQVLALAVAEHRIRSTAERDCGELVFRLGQPQAGVIDRRLGADADLPSKIARLDAILTVVTSQIERHRRARCSRGTRRSADPGYVTLTRGGEGRGGIVQGSVPVESVSFGPKPVRGRSVAQLCGAPEASRNPS